MLRCTINLPAPAKSRAEIQASYRERKKSMGQRAPSGKAKNNSKWALAQFIALDGEGENDGVQEKFIVGSDETVYHAAPHKYTLLSASTGESLFNGKKRLDSQACIDWLCDLSDEYPRAIFIIFAGGYDINHMLLYGFTRKNLKTVSAGDVFQYKVGEEIYEIEYRARKSLTLRRGREWKTNDFGDTYPIWKSRIVIWDVFGFFQENFVGVMRKWLGSDYKHFKLIQDMKNKRGDFDKVAQKLINQYNDAETEALVAIMQKVHAAVKGLNLKCHRWDGAGSVAAAMFRKHAIKQFKAGQDQLPKEVQFAARCAYAGGRIEVCKIGFHDGPVYDYDINSAYPSMMKDLPCLKCGAWSHGNGTPPPGFTLVKLRYNFQAGQRFYPLFYRTKRMQISFPSDGAGWYWYPEYQAALACAGDVDVLEYWHYKSSCDHKPFTWIEDYYETRKQWLKAPASDWRSGGEKILKLGTNSLYGKCAQQLGGTDTCPPSYHQIEWAGYITSATRAKLYLAACTRPYTIIGFATDGIFATDELLLGLSEDRELGAWSLKQPIPVGMTIAMAGVYWWHEGENKFTHFSRGFDKDTMKTPHNILAAWARGDDILDIPMRRLIGMGTACTSDTLWKMRGRFVIGTRKIRLDGKSHKRIACDVKKSKPHKKLIDLEASPNAEYGYGDQDLSFPYPIKWADGDGVRDAYEQDLEISRENEDTSNI